MVEIMEDGILPPLCNTIQCFVHNEQDLELEEEVVKEESLVSNISTFLKMPQQVPSRSKPSIEHLVEYSQSQILTLDAHVDALNAIVKRKE